MNPPPKPVLCLVAAVLAGACTSGTEAGGTASNQTIGAIAVTSVTTGKSPDANGYLIAVDKGVPTQIPSSGTVVVAFLGIGEHNLGISDVASNCTLDGPAIRPVSVKGADTVPVGFDVSCTALSQDLTVSVTTGGDGTDPDGYTISMDGGTPRPIGVVQSLTFSDVPIGPHTVVLEGLAENCSCDEPLRTATVSPDSRAFVHFDVNCLAPPP
ncbi:MAG TPA: hypothetical protein VFK36_04205 [Gemmatimonadales bacterium]|nr:hypothetical protein [Gemmatimonadales bacterium]